jgi:hypothetical protein
MMIRGSNGYEMIDHEPSCKVKRQPDRACDCGIYVPYVFATQDWSSWKNANDADRAHMQAKYRATTQEEMARATLNRKKPKDRRLTRLHALQLELYRQVTGLS